MSEDNDKDIAAAIITVIAVLSGLWTVSYAFHLLPDELHWWTVAALASSIVAGIVVTVVIALLGIRIAKPLLRKDP